MADKTQGRASEVGTVRCDRAWLRIEIGFDSCLHLGFLWPRHTAI
jgi:hypothetical protein